MIYIFDLLEFQVLAASKGIDTYYGFPAAEGEAEPLIGYAVYNLVKLGILKQEEDGLVLQPPVSAYMDEIARAGHVMVIDSGQYRLPRQCVYRGQGCKGLKPLYVCLENSAVDTSAVCLFSYDEAEFFRQLEDMEQLPAQRLHGEIGPYDFDCYWEEHIPEELWKLLTGDFDAGTEALLESGLVQTVFCLCDKASGRREKLLFLLDFPLEYCMVSRDRERLLLERYERKKAERILKEWWRDKT